MDEEVMVLRQMLGQVVNRLDVLNERVDELEDRVRSIPAKQPASRNSLPFHERLPHTSELVRLRADLFDNKVASQGRTRYRLKVFVWLDDAENQNGSIQPLFYQMYEPGSAKPQSNTYFEEVRRKLDGNADVFLIGYTMHQGSKANQMKGRKAMYDHVAVVWNDGGLSLLTMHPDQSERDRIDFAPTQPIEGEQDQDAAVARWWWNAG
jgi:hypothetical protein